MKYLKRTLPEWLIFSFFLLFVQFSSAQSTQSPYSRFGIGELQSQSFIRSKGMGGTGYGYSSPFHINFSNPASLASLYLTTFEIGVTGNSTLYETSGMTE